MADACGPGDKSVAPDGDTNSDGNNESSSGRTARLARDGDGDALGAAIFVDADDLRKLLGTDPHTTDAARVAYAVENGLLVLDADPETSTEGDQ